MGKKKNKDTREQAIDQYGLYAMLLSRNPTDASLIELTAEKQQKAIEVGADPFELGHSVASNTEWLNEIRDTVHSGPKKEGL